MVRIKPLDTSGVKFKVIQYDSGEMPIYMPNEIFKDLNKALTKPPHIAFAYCYYYMTVYLYRYCKHINTSPFFSQADIKQFLGYDRNYQGVNYIIKNGGVLDKIGYTLTTTDFPVRWCMDGRSVEFETKSTVVEYDYYEDIRQHFMNSKNYRVKLPIRAFYRDRKALQDYYQNGTFYDVDNTHRINPYVFIRAMQNEDIGVIGFYLYSYLKRNCDMFEWFDVSLEKLSDETGIKTTSLVKYLTNLEKYSYIDVIHNPYVFDMPFENRRPSSYKINDEAGISDEPRKKGTRVVMSHETYNQIYGDNFSDEPNPFAELD